MAENDLRNEEQDADSAQVSPAHPWYKRWWLMLLILLLLVVAGIGATLFILDSSSEDAQVEFAEEEIGTAITQPSPAAIYYPLTPEFVTNFSVRGRQRFVKMDMTLMLRDGQVLPAVELHRPALRNAIVMLMRGQVYDELQTPEGKELLRQHILTAIQEVLQTEIGLPGVEQVLFTNFVMQ